ncbi:hypothetical protein J0X19_11710 [Hymenobacter sp. BT186]|uniref:Uncharacterized protein n=1 Tax=Hymenobacter telluris TaxID=2816474 RepID=A0A939EZ97_9BACT|nr:hypothetical protein [Hymenobacter telluris]MBO0358613.1 hypothetical protein [Hymenobacter telluris]MBW3374639.1 hypothetical protein [Hymenobacter norwichensis]
MLKKYGEAADITAIRDAGFQWMLEDYDIDQVTTAFRQYLKTGREIPTPTDIIEILDPSVRPMCGRMYQRLVERSKEGPFALTRAEHEYIDRYEARQIGDL